MNRAVIVICDSLRTDLITQRDAPFLTELGQRSARFMAVLLLAASIHSPGRNRSR